jgi:hypothetical protein
VLRKTIAALPASPSCDCQRALAHAIVTEYDQVPPATRAKLKLILARYWESKKKS